MSNQTLYVLMGHVRYEGSDMLGVFNSWHRAQQVFDYYQVKAKNSNYHLCVYDECTIIETEMGALTKDLGQ